MANDPLLDGPFSLVAMNAVEVDEPVQVRLQALGLHAGEAAFRDIGELCAAMGCDVCTASVYDLSYPPAEGAGGGGDALVIPL